MATIDNKAFKKLLSNATIERHSSYEIAIFNEGDEDFFFTYDLDKNEVKDAGLEPNEYQIEMLKNTAYDFHEENQPEQEGDYFDPIDHHELYGLNLQMFI